MHLQVEGLHHFEENFSTFIGRQVSHAVACPQSRIQPAFAMDAVTFPWVSLFLTIRSGLQRWSSVGDPLAPLSSTFETCSNLGFKPRLGVISRIDAERLGAVVVQERRMKCLETTAAVKRNQVTKLGVLLLCLATMVGCQGFSS